ncbi:MAG: rbpA [Candidatus Saccharibacteria bacterium]|nr:rbpA [Candidatus Saccharibacteria bacterium]
MATKLFIGKLSFDTTDATLLELFKKYGDVTSAVVIMDKMTNKSRGFGFVEMNDLKAAQTAIKELDGTDFEGQKIIVSTANPPKTFNDRPAGGQSAGYKRSW